MLTVRDQRLHREALMLTAAYPGLRLAADYSTIVIPGFRLPPGWTPSRAGVLIVPPPNYPEAAPDGFYLTGHLHRSRGERRVIPGHYFSQHHNYDAEQGYFWYCLEDPHRNWDHRQDSLLTFVEAIRTYLGTAD